MEPLTSIEIRVLGSLIEKELTTPEYYPLTLNALVNACNQKTSRHPVVEYDAASVESALEALQARGLANWVHQAGSRVRKFRHAAGRELAIEGSAGLAVLGVLLLRGPQTLGEIRQRTERMHAFASLDQVASAISELCEREEPIVREWPKAPGKKETRYGQLLGEDPAWRSTIAEENSTPSSAPALPQVWQEQLQAQEDTWRREIEALRNEVAKLRTEVEEFRRQFD